MCSFCETSKLPRVFCIPAAILHQELRSLAAVMINKWRIIPLRMIF